MMNSETSNVSLFVAAVQKDKEKVYWLNQLAGHPEKDSFPVDYEVETWSDYRLETVNFSLPESVCQMLRELSKGSQERLFIVLMTGLFVLLRKHSGSKDIIIGIPVSRQSQRVSKGQNLDLLNSILAVRCVVEDTESFRQLLSRMRLTVIEAVDNRNFPLKILPNLLNLSQHDGDGFPLFDVTVSLKNIHENITNECRPSIDIIFEKIDHFIIAEFGFNAACYKRETIERYIRQYEILLGQALASPDKAISVLELISEEEKRQIVCDFNMTDMEVPVSLTVPGLIERQAEATPQATALVYKERQVSYVELKNKSDYLAGILKQKGLQPDHIVAVISGPVPEMVISLIAILKAGGAYLPIDPEYPGERIEYMLKDSGAKLLALANGANDKEGEKVRRWEGEKVLLESIIYRSTQLSYHHSSFIIHHSKLAYIIYTSGSTGKPKGVMIQHRSFIDFTLWAVEVFEHRPGYRVLLSNSYASDGAVQQIFPPLVSGGSLHLIAKELRLDAVRYLDYLKQHKINNIDEVPALMNELLAQIAPTETGEMLPDLTCLCLGSEHVPTELLRRCRRYLNHHGRIINAYGPAEASVEAAFYSFGGLSDSEESLIGKPRRNTHIYILDEVGNLCPIAVPGEICISGIGLARGYLNRPEITAEKFNRSFSGGGGGRFFKKAPLLYHTGDRGCWLPCGNIRFLGRVDDQIKIRGYRVELKEIENVLKKHKTVKDAAAVTRQNQIGETEICLYYVLKAGSKFGVLEYLGRHLPSYMLPAYMVELEKIPLTPNGKLDKKALPLPEPAKEGAEGYVAPANELEKKLVVIWSEVLKRSVETIGVETNFFTLGGHSLKAMILTSKIHKELNVKVPLQEFFIAGTIRKLAEFIGKTTETHFLAIGKTEKKEYYVLSSAQKRLYILQQMYKEGTAYNIPSFWVMEGVIHKNRLNEAFVKLIQRHEIFRTSFHMVDEVPVQRVHDRVEFALENYNGLEWSGLIRPFDLAGAPLIRSALLQLDEEKYLFMVDMHHIVSDGMSTEILIHDLSSFYQGNENELTPLNIQYRDYAEWQNQETQSENIKKQEQYWLREFEGDIPPLELPTDYIRPAVQSFEGAQVEFEIGKENLAALKTLAIHEDVTLYMILVSIYTMLLAKLGNQEAIVVGSPVAGRRHTDLEKIIGMFANTAALRIYPAGDKYYHEFLQETKERILAAFENQDYQYETLVERIAVNRDAGRNPLFDTMLVMQNMDTGSINIPGLKLSPYQYENKTAKFDLTLTMVEVNEQLQAALEYCTKLFKRETIERFIDYLKNIMHGVTANSRRKISDFELITPEEKSRILDHFNQVEIDYANHTIHTIHTIHGLFAVQAQQTPDNLAVTGPAGPVNLTYRELDQRSDRLAWLLIEKGIGVEDIVGIKLERSLEMVIGILSILKAGAAYLPIDPEYPVERIEYMLKDSGAKLLAIANEANGLESEKLRRWEGERRGLHHSKQLVYIIYTSGTTGKPKGIMLEHRNLANLIRFQYKNTNLEFRRVLQFAVISFDVSAQEIFSTLLAGGQLYLVNKETRTNIPGLFRFIEKNNIRTLFLPVSFLKAIFQEEEYINTVPCCIRHIIAAGEQLVVNTNFRKFLKERKVYLHNHYGPSETHVVTALTIDPAEAIAELPSIGKPVLNTGIYILDKWGMLLPHRVAGEIWIGGMQVGRGYLNRPELTKDRFSATRGTFKKAPAGTDPPKLLFNYHSPLTIHHSPIYKTGDLARRLEDGNIEFLGRMDHQVKIRGFRVETEEIENRLANHPRIKDAVVLIKEEKGDKYLCAYVAADSQDLLSTLREYLAKELPGYMIPSYFVWLEKIPLTPNKKVDRKALTKMGVKNVGHAYEAPRNQIEKKLVELWSDILAKDTIGINDNFFELGGHSLKAMILLARIEKIFNVKISLAEIFMHPKISELASHIKNGTAQPYEPVDPVEKKEYYALSSAQKRLFILQQMAPGNTVYNMPMLMELSGSLDREKFNRTFHSLIARHESLRTSFTVINQEFVQRIHDTVEFEFLDSDATWEHGLIRAFDLKKAPLLRVGLLKVEEEKHILMMDMHHIIADGISLQILTKEFMKLYNGEKLPPLKLQYKDFACRQNSQYSAAYQEKLTKQRNYWQEQFQGEIPALELPFDYPRPGVMDFAGNSVNFSIDSTALNTLALAEKTTLYMVLLAVFYVFLARLSNREDIAIGTPTAGRGHADLADIIGMFVNTLVLRNSPVGDKPFNMFLGELKENLTSAFANQDYQYESLIEALNVPRETNHNPLFDVMFALHNFGQLSPEIEIPTLKAKTLNHENKTTRFDLTLTAIESGNILQFALEYRASLFKLPTAERFTIYLKNLLADAVRNKHKKLAELEMIPEAEKRQLLYDFNDTDHDYPHEKTIPGLFAEQAAQTPDAIALVVRETRTEKQLNTFGGVHLSYRELNEQSNRLAGWFSEKGVGTDDIVGIMMERSSELIIGILAILKSGGAYLPIDPSYPQERIDYMLKDSNVRILINKSESPQIGQSPHTLQGLHHSRQLAYIIYTSGTTGKPRGVPVQHQGVVNLVHFHREIFKLGEFERASQVANQGFDAMAFEMWPCLLGGGALHIVPDEYRMDPSALKSWLIRFNITVSFQPTAMVTLLLAEDWPDEGCLLRVLWAAGDKLKAYPAKHYPFQLYNLYGPTEDTIWTTSFETPRKPGEQQAPLIGKPIANHHIYILGKHLNLQPIGTAGELSISGIGLARGYLNNPELTAEKFIVPSATRGTFEKAPLAPPKRLFNYHSPLTTNQSPIYKTGDLARWLHDGNIEFLGRIDQQVKIRGYRVELAEIEKQLLRVATIKDAAAAALDDAQGNKILAAYITCTDEVDINGIKKNLAAKLPHYMVPQVFMRLEKIPLTANGKVDRKALPFPGRDQEQAAAIIAPADEIEETLAAIWAEILGLAEDRISTGANFFDLGGHSLNAALMTTRIHQQFNIVIPLAEIFKTSTIKGIAELIKTMVWVNTENIEPDEEKVKEIVI